MREAVMMEPRRLPIELARYPTTTIPVMIPKTTLYVKEFISPRGHSSYEKQFGNRISHIGLKVPMLKSK